MLVGGPLPRRARLTEAHLDADGVFVVRQLQTDILCGVGMPQEQAAEAAGSHKTIFTFDPCGVAVGDVAPPRPERVFGSCAEIMQLIRQHETLDTDTSGADTESA